MATRTSLRWRRTKNPAAFSLLLAVVLVLGYFAFTRVVEQRRERRTAATTEIEGASVIEFDRFSVRLERSDEGERLSVSLRLRTTLPKSINGYVFVVARNDRATPRLWAIWPPQAAGAAITAGGHFHGATPASGQALSLTDRWERISAMLPHESGQPAFDSVTVYFVSPQGQILLSRPFGL